MAGCVCFDIGGSTYCLITVDLEEDYYMYCNGTIMIMVSSSQPTKSKSLQKLLVGSSVEMIE